MIDLAALAVLWLGTWLLHSTLLYGGAWALERARLLRSPAAREHAWRAALLGSLLTSTLQLSGLVERVPLERLWPAAASAAAAGEPTALHGRSPAPAAEVAPPALAPAETAKTAEAGEPGFEFTAIVSAHGAGHGRPEVGAPPAASGVERLRAALAEHGFPAVLVLWLMGVALGALRLLALARLARRELAGRVPAAGVLAAELDALCAERRVRRPALGVAPALAGPVSLPNGEIAVPPWCAAALDARRRRALLAHELAHQVRRDPQWQAFALVMQAVLWMQPLHALARRRLAALAELRADAWAAGAVQDPRALAECLAECAERLTGARAPRFGAAMTDRSLLVERVDSLLEGDAMTNAKTSWLVRGGALAALAAGACFFPGCDTSAMHIGGVSTTVTISDDGDASVRVYRPGYSLHMETDGATTFQADESDVATLASGCRFQLEETLDGVSRSYTVTTDPSGTLVRSFQREGVEAPFDTAAQQWLAEALPRMFCESGFDSEARVARLLAAGGPSRVLAEVDRAQSDHAKAEYLGELLRTARLDDAQVALALASAGRIESSYELHQALARALETQSLDGERFALLLKTGAAIDSDYEQAELLVTAAARLPQDEAARTAWIAAAGGIDSDYELRRAIEGGLERDDDALTAALVELAGRRMTSSYELRTVLEQVASRASDPGVAAAWLTAARVIDSDYERHTALVALAEEAQLEPASVGSALDVVAGIGSDYDKCEVLVAFAGRVAGDAELTRRYREVASTLAEYERGRALVALDQVARQE